MIRSTIAATALLLLAACARATPRVEPAVWTRYVIGVARTRIVNGVVLVGMRPDIKTTNTEAYDERTGKRLWKRRNALPLPGSSTFLEVGAGVERVNDRNGRTIWRSKSTCFDAASPAANATYAAIVGDTAYIGCSGGKIAALRLSNGLTIAAAHPMYVDSYEQIIGLGDGTLGIGGEAGGAYLHRASAIVKQNSLSTVVVFPPDRRILGMHGTNVVVADTCCQGTHSDSWPANIWLISPSDGEPVQAVSLRPYRQPLPPGDDEPGPGLTIAAGNTLYVATHHAILAYDLGDLYRPPRTLYDDLADMPTVIDDRYFSIQEGTPRKVTRTAVLDAEAGMRVLWSSKGEAGSGNAGPVAVRVYSHGHVGLVTADSRCMLDASDGTYAVVLCMGPNVPAIAHVGASPKAIKRRNNISLPQTMAVYAVGKTVP